jgi:archaellum biogenesis ATPase FlaH
MTSWGRFQSRFENILEDMKRHEALIDNEANARNIAEAYQMRQDIRSWREESIEEIEKAEAEQAGKQFQTILSWLKLDETDQLMISDSLSTEANRYPGTCNWIVKHPKMTSWLQSKPDISVLWLQGAAGSGKSVLSSYLASSLKERGSIVICHFCSYSYASSLSYDQILKSLILQVVRKDGELLAHVYEDFVLAKKSPSIPALEQLLQTLLTSLSRQPSQMECYWIIIDGLDECETDKQARIVSLMNQIASKTSSSGISVCKVLISARVSSALSKGLRRKQVISLTEEKESMGKSIKLYSSLRLRSFHQKLSQLHVNSNDIEEIEQEIVNKSDGTFMTHLKQTI